MALHWLFWRCTHLALPSALSAPSSSPSLLLLLPHTSVHMGSQRSFRRSERIPMQISLCKKLVCNFHCWKVREKCWLATHKTAQVQTLSVPSPASLCLPPLSPFLWTGGPEGRFSLSGDTHGHQLPLLPGHRQSHPSGERESPFANDLGLQTLLGLAGFVCPS